MDDSGFDELWRERLGPFLEGLETERREAVQSRALWTGGGAAIGLVAGIALALFTGDNPMGAGAGVAVMGALGGLAIGHRRVGKLRKRIKTEVNAAIGESFGLRYAPEPAEPARFATFQSYGLLPSDDRRSFEDHFAGERHGCDFELYEAHLKQRRRSDKRTYYVTVFRGVLIRINFPRKVEGVTVISRDKGWFNSLESLTRSFGSTKLDRIRLVDPKFESIFEVYGNDQVLARYMLTPSFMERLLALEEALMGKHVRALFDETSGHGELLIAAETGNLFEPGSMSEPLADQARVRRMANELGQVLAIVELLVEPAKFGEHETLVLED